MTMAAPAPSPSTGAEGPTNQMAEAERYFSQRRHQLAAALGVSISDTQNTGSPRHAVPGSQDSSPVRSVRCVGPEVFPSPFKKDVAMDSLIAKEFVEMFSQAEGEMDDLSVKGLDELRAVILAQRSHIESLQEKLQQQHRCIQQQQSELQQHKSDSAVASSIIEQQRKQLEELTSQAAASASVRQHQACALKQQQRRSAEIEEQLEKCRSSFKKAAAVHQKDLEQLQQLRRQQNSIARHIRADKSGDTAAKESALASRHAAELRKAISQRDTLVSVVKKQLKLIEVLKQQKAHLEAARLLQFTEEEFLRVVDSEGILKQQQSGLQTQQKSLVLSQQDADRNQQ